MAWPGRIPTRHSRLRSENIINQSTACTVAASHIDQQRPCDRAIQDYDKAINSTSNYGKPSSIARNAYVAKRQYDRASKTTTGINLDPN